MSLPAVASSFTELWTSLLARLESGPRARLIVDSVSELLPQSAVLLFVIAEGTQPSWALKATRGDISVGTSMIPINSGKLGQVAAQHDILQFRSEDLAREDFAHLDLRQNFSAITYVPCWSKQKLAGCIEIVSFAEPPAEEALAVLRELSHTAAAALLSSAVYESERNASLSSVLRLTRLYDIEKVFNATLEMHPLFEVICSKVQDLTGATAVNLWMMDQVDLLLVQQAGVDPASLLGDHQGAEDGVAGEVAETGVEVLFQTTDEPLLRRDRRTSGSSTASLMAAPLLNEDSLVGVLEVVSHDPDRLFNDDDLFMLTQVAGSAAQALHNSSLLQAERKIEVLQTLVSVAQEISSTLNLPRVLQAIVSQPQLVIPYERAAIALEARNKITVQAISGVAKLDLSKPEVRLLNELLSWVSGIGSEVRVSQHEDEISDPRPETREKFRRYFEATGYRGFYAVPLGDEEGSLGILSFESSDPDFLTDLHFEIIRVLASQATLALRNAALYKEVPFISILEPLIEKKRRFLAIEKRRRTLLVASAAAVLLALILLPWPMRIGGSAQVAPSQMQYIHAEADGVVRQVFVHEGDPVTPGTPLLQMEDWGEREAVASAQARYNTAMAQAAHALVSNDASTAGQRQLEANYLRAELSRSSDRLKHMTLRAAIAGTVVTPYVENLTGKKLSTGDPLLEVASTGKIFVDVIVSQRDISLIKPGDFASVKLDSFPSSTFRGQVSLVSLSGQAQGDGRVFFARILVPNPDRRLKPGMQGLAKLSIGNKPLGYVLFRDLALWAWVKLWNWFG